MPTPYGSRGGMAFGAGELRVLRRALALALHPASASAQDVQDCHRLAESVDEAVREGARLHAFLLADLARYRAALPGTASGYLTLLADALDAGYRPGPDDLAALRVLRGSPAAAALLERCRSGAERRARPAAVTRTTVPAPYAGRTPRTVGVPHASVRRAATGAKATVPGSRRRLLALPGGRAADEPEPDSGPEPEPKPEPAKRPGPRPSRPPAGPSAPHRPVPTPAEVFPPKRRPAPPAPQEPPASPPEQLAAV